MRGSSVSKTIMVYFQQCWAFWQSNLPTVVIIKPGKNRSRSGTVWQAVETFTHRSGREATPAKPTLEQEGSEEGKILYLTPPPFRVSHTRGSNPLGLENMNIVLILPESEWIILNERLCYYNNIKQQSVTTNQSFRTNLLKTFVKHVEVIGNPLKIKDFIS